MQDKTTDKIRYNMTSLKTILLISTLSLTACDSYTPTNLLKNPSFEVESRGKKAQDWGAWQHAGKEAYQMERDPTVAFKGESSFRITQFADQDYAMVGQLVVPPERDNNAGFALICETYPIERLLWKTPSGDDAL